MINFFRRFKKEPKTKEVVFLKDAEKRAREILAGLSEKEKFILNEINNEREIFNGKLKEQIEILKNLNLEKRKEDARLKERVLDNKETYIINCEKLLEKISSLETKNPEDFFSEINQVAIKFENASQKSFEIATILIGEEIAEARKTIKNFFRAQEKLYSENKETFAKEKTLKEILDETSSLEKLEILEKETNNEIKKSESSLKENHSLIKQQEQKISYFRNTDEFKNSILEKEKKKNSEISLIKKIDALKEKINLKELLSIHHRNEKLRELIRKYRNNFFQAFVSDKDNSVLEIIPKEIGEQLLEIKNELNKIKKGDESEIKGRLEELEKKLGEIKNEVERIEIEKEELEKKILKIQEREKEKISEIKNYLDVLGFEVG